MPMFVFPFAFMANTFAMMLVMIGLSLFGKPSLAADFGIVHGATVALFYSFSGNARSLILSESSVIDAAGILKIRLILLLPLGVLAWTLSIGVVSSGGLVVLLLVLRRAAEWLAEVFLSEQELQRHLVSAAKFFAIQAGLSLVLLLVLLSGASMSTPALVLWALSPLLGCLSPGLLIRAMSSGKTLFCSVRVMLPHFGSTAVIGISVYVFRLFIVLIGGQQVAGDLFSAFAMGGILGAVFSQALGPTMVRQERGEVKPARVNRIFNLMLIILAVLGGGLLLSALSFEHALDWTGKDQLFWLAVGFSLIGGGVMVVAQRIRLRILQRGDGTDVFGSDMLSNMLLISSIPFLFYGLGIQALAFLYLLGALLSWAFYASEREGLFRLRNYGWFSQKKMLFLIAGIIFLPLFFQLHGGVFNETSMEFSSGGVLALLPIPLSLLGCYIGMLLLGRYSSARTALLSLFFVFVGMILSSIVKGLDTMGGGSQKLILLIQYILPMFALVLGQQYGARENAHLIVAKSAICILLAIVPVQLLVSASSENVLLSPSVYFFSIYQHLQYVSLLFVAAFVFALFALWDIPRYRRVLHVLTLLMGVYAVFSCSIIAMLLYGLGVSFFIMYQIRRRPRLEILIISGLALSGVTMSVLFLEASGVPLKLLESSVDYLDFWNLYIKGISSDWVSALLGHSISPNRNIYPSARNYYLDFAYNFGLLGLSPLLALALYSIGFMCLRWRLFWSHGPYLGLAFVVAFLLVVDSTFKVGMRQPYPGVIMFFLWGLLLATRTPNLTRSPLTDRILT